MEEKPVMHNEAKILWQLFETSGCIIFYIMYKRLTELYEQ